MVRPPQDWDRRSMNELPRLILTRDHIQRGMAPKELASRCRSGALVRVRQGVYVDGGAWRALSPWDQYRVRVSAAAETFIAPTIFARHSAASVWRIPTIGLRHPVHALTLQNDGGRSRAGVLRHYAPPAGLEYVERDGLLVTGRVRTVLDIAAFTPFAEAVVPLDHVLRPDVEQRLPALTKEQLSAGIEGNYSAAARRRILTALDFADPRSGSAGESYSRALMRIAGFQAPDSSMRFAMVRASWATRTTSGAESGLPASSTASRSTSSPSFCWAGPRRRPSSPRKTGRTGSGHRETAWSGGSGRT